MSKELKRLQEAFEKIGISIEFLKGTTRAIRIINFNVHTPEEMELEKLAKIKSWILENKRDGHTPVIALNAKIAEVGLVTNVVVEKLFADGLLFTVPVMGFYGVSK